MTTSSMIRGAFGTLAIASVASCATAAPFSIQTPGLGTMQEEEAQFFRPVTSARAELAAVPLRTRIDNALSVYEEELGRARATQGGFLNATLDVLGLLLPISGTASAVALSDPDDIQTVAVVAGAATTGILVLDLLLKPGQKSSSAARCEAFLESAIASFEDRWGDDRSAVVGTDEEWDTYLTMRATLERGRVAACR